MYWGFWYVEDLNHYRPVGLMHFDTRIRVAISSLRRANESYFLTIGLVQFAIFWSNFLEEFLEICLKMSLIEFGKYLAIAYHLYSYTSIWQKNFSIYKLSLKILKHINSQFCKKLLQRMTEFCANFYISVISLIFSTHLPINLTMMVKDFL